MAKYKAVICDICKKDITCDDIRFKFKKYENSYVNYDDFEFFKWNKMDVCKDCYEGFVEYICKKKNEVKQNDL